MRGNRAPRTGVSIWDLIKASLEEPYLNRINQRPPTDYMSFENLRNEDPLLRSWEQSGGSSGQAWRETSDPYFIDEALATAGMKKK